ncbi:MAG: hypothetical protein WC860_08345, partial [Candidatus Margulisiibacteriota bacterium]
EAGIGSDRISDMTQNIIDDAICDYTVEMIKKLSLKANCTYTTKSQKKYNLLLNPYYKCPIKLLPFDVLADLPLADTFDNWLIDASERNEQLRNIVNQDIGSSWFEANKKDKKESLLKKIKEDKDFFVAVLQALKDTDFESYNIEKDVQGLHRWLKDSGNFISTFSKNIDSIEDNLESISDVILDIINHFKQSIEAKKLKQIFWTKIDYDLKHVKEFYSQMLFYMACNTWLTAQNSNISLKRIFNTETNQIDFEFAISGKYSVLVQVKHSDNYRGLETGYIKQLDCYQGNINSKGFYIVMNFDFEESNQLKAIKKYNRFDCKIIEIDVQHDDKKPAFSFDNEFDLPEWQFDDNFIEFEDLDLSLGSKYQKEKSKGGKTRHKQTDIIKNQIIKPMFLNKDLIKGHSVKQKAEKISAALSKIHIMTKDNLQAFISKFNLDNQHVNNSTQYFSEDKSEQIYKWCLAFSKEVF